MPKTDARLYRRICSWSQLLAAWRKARKGKRARAAAASFELDLANHLLELTRQLEKHEYVPGSYNSFYIHDPKRRLISAAPFRDRVVHHALCAVTEPIFERRFIATSFANRIGKGTHAALQTCQKFSRKYLYYLPCDIEQFFPAIDHRILFEKLNRLICDPRTLHLCQLILSGGAGLLDDEYRMRYFPGDDLFASERPRGLPIGNLTSQLWANVYLDAVDQFVKRELRVEAYLRYVDDFILFADSKARLWEWRQRIIDHLATLRLTLHAAPCHPVPVGEGIPFLGFRVFPQHMRLKRRKGVAFERRLRALRIAYASGDLSRDELMASVRSWVSHAGFGNTYGLRRKLFREQPLFPRPRGEMS